MNRTTRRILLGTIAIVGLTPAIVAARHTQFTSACAPTNTEVADNFLHLYRWMMSGDGPAQTDARTRAQIPKVDSATVAFIADTTVCRTAARAYTRFVGDSSTTRIVHVLQFGNRFVVIDPVTWPNDRAPRVTFDSLFTTALVNQM